MLKQVLVNTNNFHFFLQISVIRPPKKCHQIHIFCLVGGETFAVFYTPSPPLPPRKYRKTVILKQIYTQVLFYWVRIDQIWAKLYTLYKLAIWLEKINPMTLTFLCFSKKIRRIWDVSVRREEGSKFDNYDETNKGYVPLKIKGASVSNTYEFPADFRIA